MRFSCLKDQKLAHKGKYKEDRVNAQVMNSDKWNYMEKGNQSHQMKKDKGEGEVNESLPTRIQFLYILWARIWKRPWCTIGNEILSIDF